MWVPSKPGMISRLKDGLAWALKKGVASCDKLRLGACSLRSGDPLMGLPAVGNTCGTPDWRGNLPNGSIQVGRGRETNRDSLNSGERKGKSLNRIYVGNHVEMWCCKAQPRLRLLSGSGLEQPTIEGESPVGVSRQDLGWSP